MQTAVLKIIAEPRRRDILRLIWDQERTATEIASHFDVTRPAISQHLQILYGSGLVSMRRAGTKRIYRVQHGARNELGPLLMSSGTENISLSSIPNAPSFTKRRPETNWSVDFD